MSQSTNEVNITRLIDEGRVTRFQIATIIFCALVNLFDGIDTQSIGVAAPFICRRARYQDCQFWSDLLVGAGGRHHRGSIVWPAGGPYGAQDTPDNRHRVDRYLHAADRYGRFRTDADGVPVARRARARRSHAVFHRVDVGIRTGAAAGGDRNPDVVGISVWRNGWRVIEFVPANENGMAGHLLYWRRCAARGRRAAVFLPAGIDQVSSDPPQRHCCHPKNSGALSFAAGPSGLPFRY